MATGAYRPPLSGVAVADLTGGPLAAVGRLLADLGAAVTQVSWPGVSDPETVGPVISPAGSPADSPDGSGIPLGTAIHRAGLARLTLGPDSGEDGGPDWAALLATSDILLENTRPGSAAEARLDVPGLRRRHPQLVIVSASDFGRGHRFSRWQGTGPVFHALTSELSRSGIPDRDPLLPPGELPYEVAAAQAAVLTVSALIGRLRTGRGNRVDFSVLDGAMQALDPPFGMTGSAAAGIALSEQPRGRPEGRERYPIIACADGYVRICVLARRQWRGMFAWMGEPAEFADPRYDRIQERFGSPALLAEIARFFAGQTRAVLEAAGQRHGVPTAAVLTLDEALATDQVKARGFLRETELAPGLSLPVPAGVVEIDGVRAVADPAARAPGRPGVSVPPPRPAPGPDSSRLGWPGRPDLPLDGIRVLDFGVIVVGGDTGRILGDLGADVIKVENSAFPDGSRGALTTAMSQGYAAGHRNKRSIGINLRDPDGRALVRALAAGADIVLTNFKPGVIETLGLDYPALSEVNPGIVVVDSSAFGPTGPWSRRLGYGPLVRAAAGFTAQWVYPGEPGTFSDAITVYPDHVCARIGVLAALALLIRRERTGRGGSVSVAQSEVMLGHQAAHIAARELAARRRAATGEPASGAPDGAAGPDVVDGPGASGRDAPWGLFPAAGDDDWVAVTVRGDADWAALGQVIGRPDLLADPALATRRDRDAARARIDAAVGQWTARRPAADAMELLQAAGVPAGAMLRADDLLRWEYHTARRSFRQEIHPHGAEPYVMENIQLHDEHTAAPPARQAPLLGEQTAEIAAGLLGLSPAEITALIERGVLEVPPGTAGPAPENKAPENPVPENPVPENLAPENPAPQNKAASGTRKASS